MQKSQAPTQLTVAFASGTGAGPINAIPIPASGTAGAASWSTGFTSVNMEPIGSGGIPPFGADFNGLFNALSNAQIWQQSGYLFPYSSAFSAAVGGYPAGASLQMASGLGLWINQADSNTTNPDTTASANWIELCANAGASSIALSGATVTPTANQLGVPLLILTGALTAACKLVLPLRNGASWKILNNTTGGQTVTVGGATGSTVTISAGSTGAQEVFTDGTNFYTTSFNGAGVYLPINGTAMAATAWATSRTIGMTGDVTWTSPAINGTTNVTAAAMISNGAVTLAKMASFQANSLMGNSTTSDASPQAITLGNLLAFNAGASSLNVAPITANSLLGNAQTTSQVPVAIGLANGLIFNAGANTLGMGAITPTSINASGIGTFGNVVSASNNQTSASAAASFTVAGGGLTAAASLYPVMTAGAYNGIVALDDAGIIYSLGNQSTYGFIIAPWSSTGGGLRLDANGNATVTGTISATKSMSAVGSISINGASSGAYTALALANPSGVGIQVFANGNSAGGVGTVTSHPLTFNVNSTSVLTLAVGGAATFSSSVITTAVYLPSDENLKENIRPAEPRPLHRLVNRPFVSYDRRDGTQKGTLGTIAQDWENVEPKYLNPFENVRDGRTYIGVDYQAIAYEQAMWAGMEIDRLQAKVNQLVSAWGN